MVAFSIDFIEVFGPYKIPTLMLSIIDANARQVPF